jgi:D-aminopeptidase
MACGLHRAAMPRLERHGRKRYPAWPRCGGAAHRFVDRLALVRRRAFLGSLGAAPLIAGGLPRPRRAAAAEAGIRIGSLPPGPLDGITDVAGVRVGHVTKIEGPAGPLVPGTGPVRTGVTVVVPNDTIWMQRVAAATYVLNGNGEMTGAHWVDEAGFLEVPVALTNTLDVGRVDDGVIDWLISRWPDIGVDDDVPLPVVAECDDQALSDIQGRHVVAADAVRALRNAATGQFERGSVGAGTGMAAFGFKGGIGSASRLAKNEKGTYTVGVLVNDNTGGNRALLRIDGVPVGRILEHEYLPQFPKRTSQYYAHGRAAGGSIITVIATDAPLESRQLRELCKRAVLGFGRIGMTSHVSSGDLLIAFSTTRLYPREGPPNKPDDVYEEGDLDALFAATAEATEAAIVDALLSARTLSGAHGITFQALPADRVRAILAAYDAAAQGLK